MDDNKIYYSHFTTYINVEPLCFIPETIILLYVSVSPKTKKRSCLVSTNVAKLLLVFQLFKCRQPKQ